MPPEPRLTLITGKGGVGKTRVAVLWSQKYPQALLAETSEGLRPEAERLKIERLAPIYHFDRAQLAHDFILKGVPLKIMADGLARLPLFQVLLRLAPNLHELLLLEKWVELCEEQPVIVDAPSSGHFRALLEAVTTAREIFDGGSLRRKADRIHSFFSKPGHVQVAIVALPERSALFEMQEIAETVGRLYPSMSVTRVINRLHPQPKRSLELAEPLHRLAFERPVREAERIKNLSWNYSLSEGAVGLEATPWR